VYWRNCRHFLKSDGRQDTVKANKYIKRFETSAITELETEAGAIEPEVTHLGHKRQSEDARKFGLEGARKLTGWLKENFDKFEEELEESYKSIWRKEEEAPEGEGKLAASNSIQTINWTSAIGPLQIVEGGHIRSL
jgi:hypothetical protein